MSISTINPSRTVRFRLRLRWILDLTASVILPLSTFLATS